MILTEVKAHAYDCLANIEFWQKELQITNQKITELIEQDKKSTSVEISEG